MKRARRFVAAEPPHGAADRIDFRRAGAVQRRACELLAEWPEDVQHLDSTWAECIARAEREVTR